jgi:hypothetical protein
MADDSAFRWAIIFLLSPPSGVYGAKIADNGMSDMEKGTRGLLISETNG